MDVCVCGGGGWRVDPHRTFDPIARNNRPTSQPTNRPIDHPQPPRHYNHQSINPSTNPPTKIDTTPNHHQGTAINRSLASLHTHSGQKCSFTVRNALSTACLSCFRPRVLFCYVWVGAVVICQLLSRSDVFGGKCDCDDVFFWGGGCGHVNINQTPRTHVHRHVPPVLPLSHPPPQSHSQPYTHITQKASERYKYSKKHRTHVHRDVPFVLLDLSRHPLQQRRHPPQSLRLVAPCV